MGASHHVSVVAFVASALIFGGTATAAEAAPCPDNPDALGVSRVMSVHPGEFPRLGRMQYRASLPLAEREVVLTFDDGPLPPYTDRVLEILAQECVKATFFLVGRHAAANPHAARRVLAAGHTIGTHSQNHPTGFDDFAENRIEREVNRGIASIGAALGEPRSVAPFFRIPGLRRSRAVERYLENHDLVLWSADAVADDWTPITSADVLNRALTRLAARGNRGILLLHDIQPRTVLMLPALLAELKKRNYRIVHVVPEFPQPASAFVALYDSPDERWPIERKAVASGAAVTELPAHYGPPKHSWPRVASAAGFNVAPPDAPAIIAALDSAAPAGEVIPLPPRRPQKKKGVEAPAVDILDLETILVGLFAGAKARSAH